MSNIKKEWRRDWYDELTALVGKCLGMMDGKPVIEHHPVVDKVKEIEDKATLAERKRCAEIARKFKRPEYTNDKKEAFMSDNEAIATAINQQDNE